MKCPKCKSDMTEFIYPNKIKAYHCKCGLELFPPAAYTKDITIGDVLKKRICKYSSGTYGVLNLK
jgi:ribosomal protein L37AE/L43A